MQKSHVFRAIELWLRLPKRVNVDPPLGESCGEMFVDCARRRRGGQFAILQVRSRGIPRPAVALFSKRKGIAIAKTLTGKELLYEYQISISIREKQKKRKKTPGKSARTQS